MTNSKHTKKALFSSIVALLLCFTMLMGATFAWFTDNVSSTGNRIQAGDLEVDLVMYKDGEYTSIAGGTGDIFSEAGDGVWEPGKTQVVYLGVRNTGSLALKYNILLNIKDNELAGALEYAIIDGVEYGEVTLSSWDDVVTNANGQTGALPTGQVVAAQGGVLDEIVNGDNEETDYFALAVHMREEAGNEYENKDVTIDVNVIATQKDAEEDSFGPDYDEDSLFGSDNGLYVDPADGAYVALSTADLAKVASVANTDATIESVKYEGAVVPVVRDASDLNTAIADGNTVLVITDGNYVIDAAPTAGETLTIVGNGEDTVLTVEDENSAEGDIDYSLRGSDVVFENMTIHTPGTNHAGYAGLSATYNNCTFTGMYTLYGKGIFNNCTFNFTNNYLWTWGAPYVEFNNCTFENVDGSAKAILVHNTCETEVIVKDCTFNATTPAQTWDGIPVAAVSIDPEVGSPDAVVRFEGTNTVSSSFYSLYQVKYADEVDDVKIYVDGAPVTVTAMK